MQKKLGSEDSGRKMKGLGLLGRRDDRENPRKDKQIL